MRALAGVVLLVALAGSVSGCMSGGNAWRRVNTSALHCSPMQIVITRGDYVHVRRIRGVALAGTAGTSQPLSAVSIVIRHLGESGEVFSTATNGSGEFEAGDLPPGWYQLETCLAGFDSVVLPVRVSSRAAPTERIVIRLRPSA